jgi:hypothetical protein
MPTPPESQRGERATTPKTSPQTRKAPATADTDPVWLRPGRIRQGPREYKGDNLADYWPSGVSRVSSLALLSCRGARLIRVTASVAQSCGL